MVSLSSIGAVLAASNLRPSPPVDAPANERRGTDWDGSGEQRRFAVRYWGATPSCH